METMEEASSSPPMSSVPPGFRFHPTDEELVGYYLRKKVASQKIDLDVIRDIDLYRIEPWDLQERCRIEYESQQEWYFFSHKDKKYPSGSRTNRATMAGFWKATGRDKAVYDKTSRLIGMRKTLVFYKGRAPNGHKTDWIMHEYRLQSDHNAPTQEEGWVVCRAFKKKITNGGQSNKSIHVVWDSTYFYDESTSSAVDLNVDHYIPRHAGPHYRQHHNMFLAAEQGNNSFFCKQEEIINNVKSESNNKTLTISGISSNTNPLMNSADSFLHDLPQLESPSLPLMKRPQLTTSSLPASNKSQNSSSNGNSYNSNHSEDGQQVLMTENNNISGEKVTDWRALDKFVASQLMSQEEETTGLELPPLLMLQSDKEEGKFGMGSSGFLSSTCDCDIGIRIFEK